jgi:hypothetical protein
MRNAWKGYGRGEKVGDLPVQQPTKFCPKDAQAREGQPGPCFVTWPTAKQTAQQQRRPPPQ